MTGEGLGNGRQQVGIKEEETYGGRSGDGRKREEFLGEASRRTDERAASDDRC
jgi:hypothetical protein